jgi:hypothetical protein
MNANAEIVENVMIVKPDYVPTASPFVSVVLMLAAPLESVRTILNI